MVSYWTLNPKLYKIHWINLNIYLICILTLLQRHPRPTLRPPPRSRLVTWTIKHLAEKTVGAGDIERWGEMGGLVTSCDNQTNNPAPAKTETIKFTTIHNLSLLSSKLFRFPNQEKAFKLESYNLLKLNVSIPFKVQMHINSSSIKLMHLLVCPDIFRCRCLIRIWLIQQIN